MQYKIILFQKHLRSHILNFQKGLKKFTFVLTAKEESTKKLYQRLISYEKEISRTKSSPSLILRRILGIPNMRLKLVTENLAFTYSCLLLTNKPYCVYIENGVSIYRYDSLIAKNPIAVFLASFLIKRNNCKKLIFMSQAAQKSFLSSVNYSKKTAEAIRKKSVQCYPLIKNEVALPKKYSRGINLLFAGTFYMKGGIEIINAFKKIREKYKNANLTIISQLQIIKPSDIKYIKSIDGIKLFNAEFNKKQMNSFYRENDIFLSPTYRDSFGLALIEALSFGMPIIGTDQYATKEMIINKYNGFLYPNHPLKDYDPNTYKIIGKYRNPKDLYTDLFKYQKEGKMKPIEEFLYNSIERILLNPELLEKFSKNSLHLYNKKFHSDLISRRIESIFFDAIKK